MKLFMNEYKGYILTYYTGLAITLIYCRLMNFIKTSEIIYILLFNTSAKFQGRQKDDCVDSLSMIVAHILESRVRKAEVKSDYGREDLDI